MRRWFGVVLALFVACEAADSALAELGQGCLLDSDCTDDLVCVNQRCHSVCRQSRDCPAGQRCVRGGTSGAVCQLDEESRCALHSDCPANQLCGPDGQCRDQCRADNDCVGGQVCVSGVCADPEELQNGQLPSQENEQGEGEPCVVNSQCNNDELLCIEGKCLYECKEDYDCPSGSCVNKHCIPLAPPKPPCAPGQQVDCTCGPLPGVHICNNDGASWSECICFQNAGGSGGMPQTGAAGMAGSMGMGGSMSSSTAASSSSSSTSSSSSSTASSSSSTSASSSSSSTSASSSSSSTNVSSSTAASSSSSGSGGSGGSLSGSGGTGGVGLIIAAGSASVPDG